MLRAIVDARRLFAMFVSAVAGVWGLLVFPFGREDPFLAVVAARRPDIANALAYGYALLWFSTPFWIVSLLTSLLAIVVSRLGPTATYRSLPLYPAPELRSEPYLVLGETHFAEKLGRAPNPRWLIVPHADSTQVS